MLRRCLSIMSMIALITATSAPTFAAGFDPYFRAPDQGFETYRRAGELATGVYLHIPFSGRLGRSVSKTRFGLAFGARLPAYDRYDSRRTLTDMPKLFDLSIGLTGKESLQLNGLSIIDTPTLYADEGGKRKKKRIYPWVLGGIGVVLVATSITFLAE